MVLKKGQVTIFIIIGIILVISVGIFIYLYQAEIIRPFEEVVVPSVEKAPSEVRPIQDFITSCVEATGKDALRRVGDYGGYIDSSEFMYNPFIPTEGDAVQFSPDSDLIVPYWWYLKSGNDCTGSCVFTSMRPALYRTSGKVSIEGQLDEYVNQNLKDCLGGLAPFIEQNFEINELDEVQTETTIAKDSVYFLVKYPLRISRAGQSFAINEYLAEVDINLGKIYDLATELTNLESEHKWLEHFTTEMISAFSSLDKHMLPPMHDFDVSFGQGTIWIKSKVAEGLQEVLTSYVPLLQVGNTRLYMPIQSPDVDVDGAPVRDKKLYETLYNRGLLIPIESEEYQDLGASFTYLPWWNIYFDANCQGEICQPQSVSNTLMNMQIGLHKYDFAYDVSYPVLVEVRDFDAFKGEGYSFKFFIESNVRNNIPMPSEFKPLQPYEVSFGSMLCDINQQASGNITIFVRDARNQKGVDTAVVGYTCGSESCMLGETSNGTLVAQLPRCLGGMLSASKADYQARLVPFDVLDDQDQDVEIKIQPYRYMDFTVKKYLLGKGAESWTLDTSNAVSQALDEDTMIILTKEQSIYEPTFSSISEVCGLPSAKAPYACGTPPQDNAEGIPVIPGKYKVHIYSMKYPKPDLEIPRDLRTAGTGLVKQEFYVPEEAIIFDPENPFPSGFANFNWTITEEQLDSGNAIEFYYINIALDKVPKSRRKIEDLGVIGQAIEYSTLHRDLLEPKVYRKSKAGASTVTVQVE